MSSLHRRRQLRAELGSRSLIRSTTSTVLVPGWRWTWSMMARVSLNQRDILVVLDAVDDVAQFLQPHGRAVAVGHDHRAVSGGVHQLAVGLHREGLVRPPQRARRQIGVVRLDRVLHFVDADAARGQQVGIQLNAHGIFAAPNTCTCATPLIVEMRGAIRVSA